MNRLYYVWCTGPGASPGIRDYPVRLGPFLAATPGEAEVMAAEKRTSWDGQIKLITLDEDYAPRQVVEW